jgi:hypothetical protein
MIYMSGAFAAPDENTKITWNLSAVGDTLEYLYKEHCPVGLTELFKVSDFIKNNRKSSVAEVMDKCLEYIPISENLYKGKRSADVGCQGDYLGDGCAVFVKRLKEEQNKNTKIFLSPGTYVTKVEDGVYKVTNVVPGNGNKIWIINPDGGVTHTLGYEAWTNDMFINTSSTNHTRGVFNNSYIYTKVDLSNWMWEEYNSWDRGIPGAYAVSTAVAGMPGNRYDIKNRKKFTEYKRTGQSDIDSHTNGFVFNGKIAHLEWLGHYIIGMGQSESAVSTKYSDKAINALQKHDNAEKDGQSDTEADHFVNANKLGREQQSILSHFSKTQTKTIAEAVRMTENYARGLNKWQNVQCSEAETECRKMPGTNDYVICYFDNVLYKMEFDDVCN